MGDLTAYADGRAAVWHGDCFELLAALPDASVDSIVTDPPYGEPWARECLRVLKPGGHLLAFGGTRTWHRLAVAVEDAGFEIRDSIAWLYGSGFPKSLDVSKAIASGTGQPRDIRKLNMGADYEPSGRGRVNYDHGAASAMGGTKTDVDVPEEAQPWQGWGTALKPAFEPIVVARKPLVGTVAGNVLAHGTGALNVDGCRIPTTDKLSGGHASGGQQMDDGWHRPWMDDPEAVAANAARSRASVAKSEELGRWPANVVLDEDQAAELDQQSGTLKSGANPTRRGSDKFRDAYGDFKGQEECTPARGVDIGGASRFFYCAKAGAKERPSYLRFDCHCEGPAVVTVPGVRAEGETCPQCGAGTRKVAHPTVKPLTVMRWLARLVTPPNGLLVDTFGGSGTTAEAALLEDFRVLVMEQDGEHIPLIDLRLTKHTNQTQEPAAS